MKISEHFTLAELTLSGYAVRNGLDNSADQLIQDNLRLLCNNVLEPLRKVVGRPLHINSGYRSPEVNKAIGGAEKSQHIEGKAVDITCPGITVDELFEIATTSGIVFDQLIHEFGRWVHISFNLGNNRKQILWAVKQNGKTVYIHEKPIV